MKYQRRYWHELTELRVHVIYLRQYLLYFEKWESRIGMFLAVMSSGSIAGWAIWQKYFWVWACLIAGSQVIFAIKPYLPHSRLSKAVIAASQEMDSLALFAEHGWFDVSEGKLSSKEIHGKTMDIKMKKAKIENNSFGSTPLSKRQECLDLAGDEAKLYFSSTYGVNGNE